LVKEYEDPESIKEREQALEQANGYTSREATPLQEEEKTWSGK